MKSEYLIFDLLILALSLTGASIYKKGVRPKFGASLVSLFLVAIPFLIWDQLVTGKWWYFNHKYVIGLYFGKLPIEEVLFFLVVPYSCLIIWENIKLKVKGNMDNKVGIILLISGVLFGIYGYYNHIIYSLSVGILLSVLTLLSMIKNNWLRQKAAWMYLTLVVFLTVIFNGYLTARPIVAYNPDIKSNIYIYTVPVEDILYGLVLVGFVTFVYEISLNSKKRYLV